MKQILVVTMLIVSVVTFAQEGVNQRARVLDVTANLIEQVDSVSSARRIEFKTSVSAEDRESFYVELERSKKNINKLTPANLYNLNEITAHVTLQAVFTSLRWQIITLKNIGFSTKNAQQTFCQNMSTAIEVEKVWGHPMPDVIADLNPVCK